MMSLFLFSYKDENNPSFEEARLKYLYFRLSVVCLKMYLRRQFFLYGYFLCFSTAIYKGREHKRRRHPFSQNALHKLFLVEFNNTYCIFMCINIINRKNILKNNRLKFFYIIQVNFKLIYQYFILFRVYLINCNL